MENKVYYSNSDELCHYGVIGMKWGIRRNPSKAYARATRKRRDLAAKSATIGVLGAKKQLSATKKMYRARSKSGMKRALAVQMKANKLNMKSYRLEQRGNRWEKRMNKEFASYDIKRIPNGNVDAGKNFVYRRIYGNDSYEVTKVTEKKD